ncbi:DUF2290 domain-containing protein [Paenibacillus sp. FSL M7-1046]|uniref:DUF2290 domain-containing protein n=1 Tax=Paenibacillus sp. FSL M7-1046 TaxID=2975315 RepID=UPI0030FCFCC9
MNKASILKSINDAKNLLSESDLLKDVNKSRKFTLDFGKYSREFMEVFQSDNYDEIYKKAMKNMDFDFLLIDDSFFQFSCTSEEDTIDEGNLRYAYFENPRKYDTYEEFLAKCGFSYEECGEEFYFEYEQEIAEAKLKDSVTPIRYDYDYGLYTPIEHSISHFHFGHNNNIRVATSKILTPTKFVSFVMRNMYTKKWMQAFTNEKFKTTCLTARQACHPIDERFFTEDEKLLLHIF